MSEDLDEDYSQYDQITGRRLKGGRVAVPFNRKKVSSYEMDRYFAGRGEW